MDDHSILRRIEALEMQNAQLQESLTKVITRLNQLEASVAANTVKVAGLKRKTTPPMKFS